MLNISVLRGIVFYGKINLHTPSTGFSVPSLKCYGDAGNNEMHGMVAIRKVMGWLLKTSYSLKKSADVELLQHRISSN